MRRCERRCLLTRVIFHVVERATVLCEDKEASCRSGKFERAESGAGLLWREDWWGQGLSEVVEGSESVYFEEEEESDLDVRGEGLAFDVEPCVVFLYK